MSVEKTFPANVLHFFPSRNWQKPSRVSRGKDEWGMRQQTDATIRRQSIHLVDSPTVTVRRQDLLVPRSSRYSSRRTFSGLRIVAWRATECCVIELNTLQASDKSALDTDCVNWSETDQRRTLIYDAIITLPSCRPHYASCLSVCPQKLLNRQQKSVEKRKLIRRFPGAGVTNFPLKRSKAKVA